MTFEEFREHHNYPGLDKDLLQAIWKQYQTSRSGINSFLVAKNDIEQKIAEAYATVKKLERIVCMLYPILLPGGHYRITLPNGETEEFDCRYTKIKYNPVLNEHDVYFVGEKVLYTKKGDRRANCPYREHPADRLIKSEITIIREPQNNGDIRVGIPRATVRKE